MEYFVCGIFAWGDLLAQSGSAVYTYDANGTPMTASENGTVYYYVTNLQGDVVAILNSSGTEVVRYSYNAWGKKRNISGTMASTLGTYNPLRYRGYVYDQETDLYYLQSRYYNPAIGRFLNADAFTSTGDGIMGNNMFAYCGNNPVNRIDKAGERYEVIDPGAVGGYGGGFSLASLLFPFAWLADIFGGSKAKVSSKAEPLAIADSLDQSEDNEPIYYGADLYGGTLRITTPPMGYDEAVAWSMTTARNGVYTDREGWGLYTYKYDDALAMVITLSPIGPVVLDPVKKAHRAHFHTALRNVLDIPAPTFHVWYG